METADVTHMTYEELLAQARLLSLEDESRLLAELMADLNQRIEKQQQPKKRRSLLEFEGIGHGTWRAVGGVDEFLKQERASWEK